METPKKKTRRRGRIARAKYHRRMLRQLEAEAAARDPHGTKPQLIPGAGAGQPPTGHQMAHGGGAQRGGGEVVSTPTEAPESPPGVQTALFERRDNIRSDARLVAKAIEFGWLPKAEVTEAIMTKASMQALEDKAKPHEVTAVAKLHLVARAQEMAHVHHQERMDYHDRALEHRIAGTGAGGGAGVGVHVHQGDGKDVSVLVYLPDNGRDPDNAVIVDLPPEQMDPP
jgi:hypothetical protein